MSDQILHKCTTTDDGERLEISDVGSRGIVLSSENKDADQLHGYCYSIPVTLCANYMYL